MYITTVQCTRTWKYHVHEKYFHILSLIIFNHTVHFTKLFQRTNVQFNSSLFTQLECYYINLKYIFYFVLTVLTNSPMCQIDQF